LVEGAAPDSDLYLMEKAVMPVLLQGLDALSRHVDKCGSGGGLIGGGQAPFNPLTWLAQYLLRNHPAKVHDHRSPVYQRLEELANIERGRRCLLRRRDEMEEEWIAMGAGREPLAAGDLPEYLQRLDGAWGLDGAFWRKFPTDFSGLVSSPEGSTLLFTDVWEWFEGFVRQNDLIRASTLSVALGKKQEATRLATQAQEERAHREEAMRNVMEVRRSLEEEFESVSADMYTDEVIGQILNASCFIQGVQEQEGGPPLKGVHIELVVAMLRVWGFEALPPPGNVWNGAALSAWLEWREAYGPEGASPRMDATNLRHLMDKDAFQAFLLRNFPAPLSDIGTTATSPVEIRAILGAEGLNSVVEATDEETGLSHRLVLPEVMVGEVRSRLAEADAGGGDPVLARVDFVTERITVVLPPEA